MQRLLAPLRPCSLLLKPRPTFLSLAPVRPSSSAATRPAPRSLPPPQNAHQTSTLRFRNIVAVLLGSAVTGYLGKSYVDWTRQKPDAALSRSSSSAPSATANLPPIDSFAEYLRLQTQAVKRFSLALYTFGSISLDYKLSLRNLQPQSDEYKTVRSLVHQRSANKLLYLCKSLKGFYTKAGQHVASLNYAVPKEFTSTLAVLQDNAPFDSFADVEAMFARELGAPISAFFDSFEPVPIAAASLAQVHRAVEKGTGRVLAVKVQHPHLDHDFASDIWSMRKIAQLTNLAFPDVNLSWIVDEFEKALNQELDFVHEGRNAERAAANFRNSAATLKIPGIVWNLSSRRILAMEFISGIKVNDPVALRAAGIDPKIVSKYLAEAFGEMIFLHSYVHCDLHPGNLLVRWWPPLPNDDELLKSALAQSAKTKAAAAAAAAAASASASAVAVSPAPSAAAALPGSSAEFAPPAANITAWGLLASGWSVLTRWAAGRISSLLRTPTELERIAQLHRQQGSQVQLVVLDHGLYRQLDNTFRINYCKLWKSLVTQDAQLLQEASTALGAGEYAYVFPLIFTFRAWSSRGSLGQSMNKEELKQLRDQFKGLKFTDIIDFMENLPRDMLLVMRTNNLVRSINQDLGGSSLDRFGTLAKSAIIGLYRDESIDSQGKSSASAAKQNQSLWARLTSYVQLQRDLVGLKIVINSSKLFMALFQDPDRERL